MIHRKLWNTSEKKLYRYVFNNSMNFTLSVCQIPRMQSLQEFCKWVQAQTSLEECIHTKGNISEMKIFAIFL